MVRYSLDPENPTKSCKSRGSIFMSTLRTLLKPPRPLRVYTSEKSPSSWKMSLSRAMSDILSLQWWSWLGDYRPNNGFGRRVPGTKRVLNFYRRYPESNTELEGFVCRFSEHWALPCEQVAKMQIRIYRAHGQINPHKSSLCHIKMILTGGGGGGIKLFLNQKRKLHRSKRHPTRNWRIKNLWLGINVPKLLVNANES